VADVKMPQNLDNLVRMGLVVVVVPLAVVVAI
jgi:hypothetical protein